MKATTKLLKTVKSILEKKDTIEKLKKEIEKAENSIMKLMGEVETTSVEDAGMLYTVTLGDNVRNKLSEDGKRAMINIPYDSPLWEKKPDINKVMNNEELKRFVIRSEFRKKVLISKKPVKE